MWGYRWSEQPIKINIQRCDAVYIGRHVRTFQRNLLPLCSMTSLTLTMGDSTLVWSISNQRSVILTMKRTLRERNLKVSSEHIWPRIQATSGLLWTWEWALGLHIKIAKNFTNVRAGIRLSSVQFGNRTAREAVGTVVPARGGSLSKLITALREVPLVLWPSWHKLGAS
jgi:hypothetical protein